MKRILFIPSLPLAAFLIFGALIFSTGPAYGDWQLVWSDEFTNADGSSPDPTKWGYDIGNGDNGWGNAQLEYDTSRTNNVRIQGGNLVIEADQESYDGFNYTSTRMNTKGKWSWTYGRIEARIKIPKGQGIWPAFWMLGANIDSVPWPGCGEIDIMENIGKTSDQGTEHGTIHGPQGGGDYNGGSGVGSTYTLPGGAKLSDDFHIYAVEWTPNQIKWYLDTNNFFTATPASLPSGATWVFTAPQFIILNVAVGGYWPGDPDGTTVFPQQMLVDYVHVYNYVASSPPDAPTGLSATPGGTQVALSWSASNGATNYNIKRSMINGGPYTLIGTSATTSYTDTGLANGTTYYYVVSGVNSYGEGTNSAQISATTTVPSANLALYKPTMTSSNESAAYPGTNAVDGNYTTRWSSAFSDPQWIYVDLQAYVNVNRVKLTWEAAYATSFQIQVSPDATNWTSIYSTTTGTGGTNDLTGLSGTGRYVRMYGTVRKTVYGYSIYEFEVYGSIFVPTNLTATAGNQKVSLSWDAVPAATSYNVKRSTTSGGPYTTIASPTTASYTDTSLDNGTPYYYVISQVNTVAESSNSVQVTATPFCSPPPTPAGLTTTPGDSLITLKWNASSGATGYNLKRSLNDGGPYTLLAGGLPGTNYADTSVIDGTAYYYVVSAFNASCESSDSTQVSATPACTPPAVPASLTATPGDSVISLKWNAASGATAYNLKRSLVNGGPYTLLVGGLTTTNYTDSVVTNGTPYYYVVSAYNAAGCESTDSTQASATPVCTPPATPAGLTATPGDSLVSLKWNASGGATAYNLKRSLVNGGPYTLLAGGLTATNYTDSVATNGTTYYYVVSAYNAAGCESTNSTQAIATPVPAPPATPAGLTATPGDSVVSLVWNTSSGATGYNLKRSLVSGGPYALLVGGLTTTNYTDSVVTNGTTYYYVVSARNANGQSTNSTQVSATPVCTPPAAPAGLTATPGVSVVSLVWNASSGATNYNLKRSLNDGGPYTLLAGGLTTTNYTDSVVTNGTIYYYVVSALNAGCESSDSTQASATPASPANHPPVLAAIANQSILAGQTLLVTNSATDSDTPAQTLTFSLLTAPANAAINSSSGLFSWRPTMAQAPSTQTVAVVVSDNGTPIMSATQSFTATVLMPSTPALNGGSIANGRFGFWINGDTGPDYTILASTNLTTWDSIYTNYSPSLPCYWVDTNSPAIPYRFYRTVLGP